MCFSAAMAGAFTAQEEAVKTEGDTDEGDEDEDEDDVKQAADEDKSEEAEAEKIGECHTCSVLHEPL